MTLFFSSLTCCLIFFSLSDISLNLEKFFSRPLYQIKSLFNQNKSQPLIEPKNEYTIVLIGDSMTEYLGNTEEIEANLKKYYPNKKIDILNYGFSSTNILSVLNRLENDTPRYDYVLPAVLKREFDLIFIESFGYNPLSEFSLDEGLKKQEEALGQIVEKIRKSYPKALIVFYATIFPSKQRYAEGVLNITTEQRVKSAQERIAYIKNHIDYAKSHNIPLLNIFEKSAKDGDGNIDYINTNDFIHPSVTGIYFISSEISNFIFLNRLIPL